MEQIDIVTLIENNPVTKLSKDYNVKLLVKIKEQFTNFEQQLFLSSFYCYLNFDPVKEFVIDLDNIWKWLGFSQKINAKTLLEKQFVIDKDYIKSLLLQQKQTAHVKGGHNKEIFMLNIDTFKKFCLKAGTKKADEIHDYYMKLEKMIQNILQNKLKLELTDVEFKSINQDVLLFLNNNLTNKKFDIIFLDPPYKADQELLVASLQLLVNNNFLKNGSKIYFESDKKEQIFTDLLIQLQLKLIKSSKAGKVYFYLVECVVE